MRCSSEHLAVGARTGGPARRRSPGGIRESEANGRSAAGGETMVVATPKRSIFSYASTNILTYPTNKSTPRKSARSDNQIDFFFPIYYFLALFYEQ